MRDVAEPIASASDSRETLEPMLDDLARGLGYERALILRYDASSSSLRGVFGLAIKDDQARELAIQQGLRTLQYEAIQLVQSNVTTMEEVVKHVLVNEGLE